MLIGSDILHTTWKWSQKFYDSEFQVLACHQPRSSGSTTMPRHNLCFHQFLLYLVFQTRSFAILLLSKSCGVDDYTATFWRTSTINAILQNFPDQQQQEILDNGPRPEPGPLVTSTDLSPCSWAAFTWLRCHLSVNGVGYKNCFNQVHLRMTNRCVTMHQ